MDELRLTGNSLKGSRPFLSFDKAFDELPHLQLLKEMFTQVPSKVIAFIKPIASYPGAFQVFNTPRGHPKSQPFYDHIISMYYLDGKIWFRHYQVCKRLLFALRTPCSDLIFIAFAL